MTWYPLVESLEDHLYFWVTLGCLLAQMVCGTYPCCWHDSHGPCPNCRYLRSLSNHACQFLTPFFFAGDFGKSLFHLIKSLLFLLPQCTGSEYKEKSSRSKPRPWLRQGLLSLPSPHIIQSLSIS